MQLANEYTLYIKVKQHIEPGASYVVELDGCGVVGDSLSAALMSLGVKLRQNNYTLKFKRFAGNKHILEVD